MKIIIVKFNSRNLMIFQFILAFTATILASCGGNSNNNTSPATQQRIVQLGPAIQNSTNSILTSKTVIGDLNGDGLNDVATIRADGYDRFIYIYYQGETNQLGTVKTVFLDTILINDIAIGDINNDGKDDLIISGETTTAGIGWPGRIVVFYQDPATGSLMASGEFTVSSSSAGSFAIGDLNSDGRNDIAVLADWGFLSIFYQNSDGTLGPEFIHNIPYVKKFGEIHIADMDNDGHDDIVVQTGNLQLGTIKQNTSSLPGTLNATPEYYSVTTSYWSEFYAFAVGDLNGDGKNDVVVIDPGNNGYMNIFLQNSSGKLDNPKLINSGFTSPYGVEIADINGDGLNDIAGDRVDPGKGHILVWYQDKDHSFNTPADYTFTTISGGGSAWYQNLSIGDVTGDGRPDAVVTWSNEGLFVLPNSTH